MNKFEVGKVYKSTLTKSNDTYKCLFVTDQKAVLLSDKENEEYLISHAFRFQYEEVEEPQYVLKFLGVDGKQHTIMFGKGCFYENEEQAKVALLRCKFLGKYHLVKVEE